MVEQGTANASVRTDMLAESRQIIDAARTSGVVLRLIGGLAVRHYCVAVEFCDRDYSDIDMVGLSRQMAGIQDVFGSLGYNENIKVAVATGKRQLQFYRECTHRDASAHYFIHPDDHVDIFINTFRMDHDISLKNRLKIEDYTISISDLLLSKMQIHSINEKDIRDILTILKDIPGGEEDVKGIINTRYIAGLCANDWGLYSDVMQNLDKCTGFLLHYPLTNSEKDKIRGKLAVLSPRIRNHPKTLKWKLRAKLGSTFPWYRKIEDQGIEVSDIQGDLQKHERTR